MPEYEFEYFTSELSRKLTGQRVLDTIGWIRNNNPYAILAPDRGGRVPALLLKQFYSTLFPADVLQIRFCNPDPLLRWTESNRDDTSQERLEKFGRYAASLPDLGRFIADATRHGQKNRAVLILDNTHLSGRTFGHLYHALEANGFRNVKLQTTSPFNEIPLIYADVLMHDGFPEEALGIMKNDSGGSSTNHSSSKLIRKLREEIKMWACEIYQSLL